MSEVKIPAPERPGMKDYGISTDKEGLMDWQWVDEQMTKARNYWVCTVSPEGKPHAAPVWGVWVENTLYFGSGRTSRKGRNIMANPNAVIHLESGDDTVIFEGEIVEVTDNVALQKMATAYGAKYPSMPSDAADYADNPTYTIKPHKVLAWKESDFPKTATRWRFDK